VSEVEFINWILKLKSDMYKFSRLFLWNLKFLFVKIIGFVSE